MNRRAVPAGGAGGIVPNRRASFVPGSVAPTFRRHPPQRPIVPIRLVDAACGALPPAPFVRPLAAQPAKRRHAD